MNVLIIGVRRKCYEAALKLGYDVLLWSDGKLHQSRKKNLKAWLEVPYESCANGLSAEVETFLSSHKISRVIANTEETVILGAQVRKFLGLKSLAIDVTQRFHNKFVMKNSAKQAGIPITKYELISSSTSADELIEKLGLPLVVKPVDDSGARDVKIAKNRSEVAQIISPGLLAESYVVGSELSVETFIHEGRPVFHNITDYLHQWKKSYAPAHMSDSLRQQVIDLNDKVIEHFGVDRGMTHAEFYITDHGPVFGEIAIRPPGGYYMELIERVYGFDSWKCYVQLACGYDPGSIFSNANGYAAVMLLHPGAGRVLSIEGESIIRESISEIMEFKLRVKPGDIIDEHTNTSNEVGHIIFWKKTHAEMLEAIVIVEKNLVFKMEALRS